MAVAVCRWATYSLRAVCMEYGVHICINSARAVGEGREKENKGKERKQSVFDRMPIRTTRTMEESYVLRK